MRKRRREKNGKWGLRPPPHAAASCVQTWWHKKFTKQLFHKKLVIIKMGSSMVSQSSFKPEVIGKSHAGKYRSVFFFLSSSVSAFSPFHFYSKTWRSPPPSSSRLAPTDVRASGGPTALLFDFLPRDLFFFFSVK